MSQDQQFLTPAQQDQLFQKMKEAGLLSQDQGQSQNIPDSTAQTGVSPADANSGQDNAVDYSRIQNLFRDVRHSSPVVMQDGDKIHPQDAIQTIVDQMTNGQTNGPKAPAGVSLATGPDVKGTDGHYKVNLPAEHPLLRALGVTHNYPVTEPNYFQAANQAGVTKYLPNGLAQMPDGTPFVGKSAFEQALLSQKAIQNPNNPPISLDDALTGNIITQKQYDSFTKQGLNGTDTKPATVWRIMTAGRMAGAKEDMVALGNNRLEQSQIEDLMNGVSDASKNPAVVQQVNTLNWAVHGRQILSTPGVYDPKTGQYNLTPQQLTELGMDLNRIMTGSSDVAESAREDIQAATAQGNFSKLAQYFGFNNVPATYQDLAVMYRDMLDRQGQTSNAIVNNMLQRQIPRGYMLKQTNPTAYNAVLEHGFGSIDYNAVMGSSPDAGQLNPTPMPNLGGRGGVVPAAPVSKPTGKIKTAAAYLSKFH